jgi:diguanylate cyclase (GGDEF) domain
VNPNRVPDFLAALPLFAEMSGLETAALASRLSIRSFREGELIFREGESGGELYIVGEGRVGSYVTEVDGARRQVYEFAPGVLFGEMAVIEGEPRTATCYAMRDTILLALSSDDFYGLVRDESAIAFKLLSSMARAMSSWLVEASGLLGGLVHWGEVARKRAVTDELSGLFNRRFLEETMATRLDGLPHGQRRCSLLMLDIDRFRDVNARCGEKGGDRFLAEVAKSFAPVMREGEVSARLSGDEFAIFLPSSGLDRALELGESLRERVALLRFDAGSGPLSVTISGGAAASPDHAQSRAQLLAAADGALFKAKEGGRNRIERAY